MIKLFNIKSIVTFSNIFIYLILLIIYLFFIINKFNINIDNNFFIFLIIYFIFFISLILFITYNILRFLQLKKTSFQLTIKYIWFMNIFYFSQYLIFIFVFIYLILLNINIFSTYLNSIIWYIFSPIIFLTTIITSFLESIVRIEEKIFLIKKEWNNKKK